MFFRVYLFTFSPFGDEEFELVEFEIVIFVAGKRSRFNRIGFVLFPEGDCLDDINKRLRIDGAEQGNEISIGEFAKMN